MRKLRVDELKVDSFPTTGSGPERGTVHGHGGTSPYTECTCLIESCLDPCGCTYQDTSCDTRDPAVCPTIYISCAFSCPNPHCCTAEVTGCPT